MNKTSNVNVSLEELLYSRSCRCNICGNPSDKLVQVADYSLCERCFEDLQAGEIELDNGDSCT